MSEPSDVMSERSDVMSERSDVFVEGFGNATVDTIQVDRLRLKEVRADKLIQPKQIAMITLCGYIHIPVFDDCDFIRPTEEQIKNLHDRFCINVELFDEEEEGD